MSEELKNMHIMIGGRSYPLRVKPGDEESIRELAGEVNEKINDFKITYLNKDIQDCIAMTLLTYAVENHKLKHSELSEENLVGRIDKLHSLVDEVLK